MQLALDLGATLGELNKRMSSSEFSLWSAMHQAQPRGVQRDNFHAALIASILANTHAPKGKTFNVSDFMHEDQETKRERDLKGFIGRMRSLSKPEKK